MSIQINQQKQLIKQYYNLLVGKFIKNPLHKNFNIVFENDLGSSINTRTLGHTRQTGGRQHWKEVNGVEVPGTRWQAPFNYTISFLNNYQNEEQLREVVVHEFTHHYLFATIGNHDHDDRFYSTMEELENYLDKNQGLSPRVDRSHDRNQYEGDNISNSNNSSNQPTNNHSQENNNNSSAPSGGNGNNSNRDKCPECSLVSPNHSPLCSYNQNNPQQNQGNSPNPQKEAEFNRLKKKLETTTNLDVLYATYQNIKANFLYYGEDRSNNKKLIDDLYQKREKTLQLQGNQNSLDGANSLSNGGGWGNKNIFLIFLIIILGIMFLVMAGYLLLSDEKKSQIPVKKRVRPKRKYK